MSILGAIGGVAGSLISGLFGNSQASKQAALQKQFAQNQIQWKVADAKAAGVHPLAALGVQPHAYAPVTAGVPDLGPAMSSLGNAVHRASNAQDRMAIDLNLEKAALENEHLRAQINAIRALRPQSPPVPSTGTGISEQQPQLTRELHSGEAGVVRTDPGMSDAQTFEDRYGESADFIEGPMNRFYDAVYQRTGMPWQAYRDLVLHRMQQYYFHGRNAGTRHYRHR